MRNIKRICILAFLFSFLGAEQNVHADKFVQLPAANGKQNKHLKIRFVKYDGGTNGQMVIEVKNLSRRNQKFSADGIYFVPQGDPEKAPQRLGASGPILEVVKNKVAQKAKRNLNLKAGQTKRLRLEVFCIDSHRPSPNRKTKFAVAAKLLPAQLRRDLKTSNEVIYKKHKQSVSRAKGEIQQNMWKTRDADWVELEGERTKEK